MSRQQSTKLTEATKPKKAKEANTESKRKSNLMEILKQCYIIGLAIQNGFHLIIQRGTKPKSMGLRKFNIKEILNEEWQAKAKEVIEKWKKEILDKNESETTKITKRNMDVSTNISQFNALLKWLQGCGIQIKEGKESTKTLKRLKFETFTYEMVCYAEVIYKWLEEHTEPHRKEGARTIRVVFMDGMRNGHCVTMEQYDQMKQIIPQSNPSIDPQLSQVSCVHYQQVQPYQPQLVCCGYQVPQQYPMQYYNVNEQSLFIEQCNGSLGTQ